MYLLNAQQIRTYVAAPYGQYLDIVNFAESSLQHTSYYFRLGPDYELKATAETRIFRLTEEKPTLLLEPNSYAVIKTLESFSLSDKVLGILGQTSKLMAGGLQLIHSPFIDPLFQGQMELGLSNLTSKSVTIRLGQIIGKVSFFDISDTYPISVIVGSISQSTFARRRPLRDDDPVHDQRPILAEEEDEFDTK
jgi:deoxycytidine triphosphate deaminase